MTTKVLVTGAAGYLGSIICERLLEAGYEVLAVDNLMYGQQSLFHLCGRPGFDFRWLDVRNAAALQNVAKNADVIIPLAAIVGAPACDRDVQLATAVNFEAIRDLNRTRSTQQLMIYPTTNSGYGTKSGDVHCTEETPLEPISVYGRTKSDAESELLQTNNVITFRLATVFGMSPRMRLDLLVNHFVYAACTDGYLVIFEKDFKRNFVHIRDVADCFVFAIQNSDRMIGRPYNVGLDRANLSKQELAELVKEFVPKFYLHFSEFGSDPDKRNYIVSNDRLRKVGFEAKRSVESGIQELIKGYQMFPRSPFKNI